MRQSDWQGVFPAITTPFDESLAVDHAGLKAHVAWLASAGSAAAAPPTEAGSA